MAREERSERPKVVQPLSSGEQKSGTNVTPATDERRRRHLPTSEKQLSPTTTTEAQTRPRDYNAIYAWFTSLSPLS